ncbi:MAG TPA: protein kinase [Pyrinomonadaceae bacterium]|nr:protein kinase [Pyrinomonadaceae bacterium]
MTPERWQQVEEIFQAALDRTPEERARFVSEACANDISLKRDVEVLLSQHESAGDLLAESNLNSPLDHEEDADPMIGRRLGNYRIERELGRGGMGAVYEAARIDNEFRKRAAIKLVKRGMDTDFVLRRFRKERQILAALDHPNIALLLDGGTTDDGLPYFVMEYIEGQPLYRYCDAHQLTVAERLRLFLSICDALHYAHQKQVIHRDIKPSNVLVTLDGVPKLLDFGIAKLLNPELVGDITHDPTVTAMRLMTPEYASPEQVQGAPTSPTTDVYSLGVLLYELLTGHRPYRLRNRAPHEMARVICEETPAPPSFVISRPEDLLPKSVTGNEMTTVEQVYSARNATAESLRRDLAGDLDTIVMRALRKEPERRYQTAEQLRDDISRYLEGQPISAFPESSPSYFTSGSQPITENSLAVLPLKLLDFRQGSDSGPDYLGTGLADALITRLSTIRRFAVRPTSSVLRYGADADPLVAGRELGVAFVLDGRVRRAGERIRVTIQLLNVRDGTSMWAAQFDEKFTDVLNLEDTISSSVAEAIIPHLTGDERLRLAKRGTDNPQAHEAYLRGRYYWNTFSEEGFARAIVCYNQAIALDPNYAVAYAGVAAYHSWLGSFTVLPFAECAAAAYEAASTAVTIDPMLAEGYAALGQAILCKDFDWERAERQLQTAIELNPNYSVARIWYALQLTMEGRCQEGLHQAKLARDLDPLAIISRFSLAWCSYHARRFNEGYLLAQETLATEPNNLMMQHVASFLLSRLGRHDEAIAMAEKCVALMGKASHTMSRLGSALAEAGKVEEAEAVLREMHEITSHRHISPYHLALVNCSLGHVEQGLELLELAYETRDAKILWMAVDPELDQLHGKPRFDRLLRKLKHPLRSLSALQLPSQTGEESSFASSIPPASTNVTSPVASPAAQTLDSGNEEARQLYTAGRYYATRRTAEGLWQAIDRLKRAVELDPAFALAHSELADCYSLLNWYVEPPPADAWDLAKQSALNAVTADSQLAEARASLGFVRLHYDRDWEGAERELRTAIQLKPGAQVAHRWYAFSLSAMGRHEEAIVEMERAREISPQSAVLATAVANVLFLAGKYDDAIEQCRRSMDLDSGAVSVHTVLRWCYEKKGMHREALAVFEQERVFAGDTATTHLKRASVLAAVGRNEEARAILIESIERRPKQWVSAYEIAIVYCWLGDYDNAFRWLAQAEREHAVGFTFVRVDPRLEGLRSDPRFQGLLRGVDRTMP